MTLTKNTEQKLKILRNEIDKMVEQIKIKIKMSYSKNSNNCLNQSQLEGRFQSRQWLNYL